MRSVPTPSDARSLRAARDALVADGTLRGESFGRALASLVDAALTHALHDAGANDGVVVCALGSYGRRELCPQSDVDVLLVDDGARAGALADALWYPLWDAGFVLGHAARTPSEAVAFADEDLDGMTAMLDLRVVAGDARVGHDLLARVRELARRRRTRVVSQLAAAAAARVARPGPVAEMLEPNLKDGAGGLRDLQSLDWAGWARGEPGGLATLVDRGYLRPGDPDVIARARALLLDARVALHRCTGRAHDVLALQDQDAVADATGFRDADELVRALAGRAREVAWIAADAWERLQATERGPIGRLARRDRRVAPGVVVRDGRVVVESDATVDPALVLRVAAAAAERHAPIDRATLERLRSAPAPRWTGDERRSLIALLRAGRDAIPVLEALDQVGLVARLFPEWEHVRSLPQRNAYHRYTVDRHLLEAVAQCAAMLDDDGYDGHVAAECDPEVLLLGALLHDVAKGRDGDHSVVGASVAREVGARLGLDGPSTDTLAWLVANHLALAETATRRDLSDDTTIERVARLAGTPERLALLYLLTVGDSRATGPAAWSASKAALVRELYVKAQAALVGSATSATEHRDDARDALASRIGVQEATRLIDGFPEPYANAFALDDLVYHASLLDRDGTVVEWGDAADGHVRCTVVARDRPGLLATAATALALDGLDVRDALAFTHRDGRALDVFTVVDRFGRLDDASRRATVAARVARALDDGADRRDALTEHVRRYARARPGDDGRVYVEIDVESTAASVIVEVHAPDRVGLLAQLAGALDRADLDVRLAKVETMADRVVDVFYVRNRDGTKPTDATRLAEVGAAIRAELGLV